MALIWTSYEAQEQYLGKDEVMLGCAKIPQEILNEFLVQREESMVHQTLLRQSRDMRIDLASDAIAFVA